MVLAVMHVGTWLASVSVLRFLSKVAVSCHACDLQSCGKSEYCSGNFKLNLGSMQKGTVLCLYFFIFKDVLRLSRFNTSDTASFQLKLETPILNTD